HRHPGRRVSRHRADGPDAQQHGEKSVPARRGLPRAVDDPAGAGSPPVVTPQGSRGPEMSAAGVQRVTALILMLGGLLGGVLVVLGSALYAAHGGLSGPALEVHRAVRIGAEHPPEVFVSIRRVIRGLTARPIDPLAVIALGLVLLLATPVLGVAAAIP